MIETLTTIAFAAVMVAALVSDARTKRIPNWLILAGLAAAILLRGLSGWGILLNTLLGAGVGLAVTFPLFALGAIGAGDAKLFMVVGAFMGPRMFFTALLVSGVIGGLLGIGAALRQGVLLPLLFRTRDLAVNAVTLGRRGERPRMTDAGALTVPYGVAIALGSLVVWFV